MTVEQVIRLIESLAGLLPIGVAAVLFVARMLTRQQKKDLLLWVERSYWATEQMCKMTPSKADDKVAAALKYLSEQLARELSEDEKKLAKAEYQRLAGQQNAAQQHALPLVYGSAQDKK